MSRLLQLHPLLVVLLFPLLRPAAQRTDLGTVPAQVLDFGGMSARGVAAGSSPSSAPKSFSSPSGLPSRTSSAASMYRRWFLLDSAYSSLILPRLSTWYATTSAEAPA